jgi:hypothetical protein
MDRNKYSSSFGFIDLLFNLLVGFVFLFFIAYILINPIAKKGIITPPDVALITAQWNDYSTADVDIWIRDPHGRIMSFQNKVISGMHLEKDDLGNRNDTVWVNGEDVINPTNQEVIHIQQFIPGTYRVSVHLYNQRGEPPQNVTVKLKTLSPYKEYATKDIILSTHGQEIGVFEFKIIKTLGGAMIIDGLRDFNGSIARSRVENNYSNQPRNSRSEVLP